MRYEKTEETKIRKAEAKIWREHGLERPADSPKICDLEPALISTPHRHDHHDHSPIAELERQHLLPAHDADVANKNQIDSVIQHKQGRERCYDHALETARLCPTHNRRQQKRQRDSQENDYEMRGAVSLKRALGIHRKIDNLQDRQLLSESPRGCT